ncbi:LysE family transporter [Roseomonas marmotae]|uniref:LysE family transporter n=2 Tax=Roseomonas marmotae TaxID=2768161 RepID=A0ABS3K6Q3_9PROT|nr:LysE family transporter [Roseomonas marmotae]MBO1073138.1 LysE family transporter [Roseomonas marmotae]
MSDTPLFVGLALGFSILTPVGPMGLLCIQRSFAAGMRIGFCTGLGATTVQLGYGALILLGLGSLPEWSGADEKVTDILSGVFLLLAAARILMRRKQGRDASLTPLAAYLSAAALHATAPMPLVLTVSRLSPHLGGDAPGLLGGMLLAALLWWGCLSGGVALLRPWLRPQLLLWLNQVVGMMLTAHGTLALARVRGFMS